MKHNFHIILVVLLISLQLLVSCGENQPPSDDTDTGTNTESPTASSVVTDGKVHYVGAATKDSYLVAINKIIHIVDLNEENAVPECFCRDTECSHSGGNCPARIGVHYPIIIDSGESSVMYWMHKQSRGQINDTERLAEIEEVLDETIRSAGAFYKYDLKTGERTLIAELLPFVDRPDFYYNGKIYMDASLNDLRSRMDVATSKKYHAVHCVDMATGDYKYLDIGKNAVPIGIYNEKLYFTDAETYWDNEDIDALEPVTVTDGKIYAASLDLSEYEVYSDSAVSHYSSIASDGVFYFCKSEDNSVYALDVSKNEKEAKKVAENVYLLTVHSSGGDLYYSVNDNREIEYGDRTAKLYTNGIIYRYDSETGATEEIFGKDMGYDISYIDYADEEKIVFSGNYYGEDGETSALTAYEYRFETDEIKVLYVYS